VSSALQASAASAMMPAQHRMVRMFVVQVSGGSEECPPQTPGTSLR
jgi:hypothetical protein